MLTKDNFFFCYSSKLSKYLASKGFTYLIMARDMNKDNLFSLYEKTDQLKQELDRYKQLNK
jgi:hypothetical protein